MISKDADGASEEWRTLSVLPTRVLSAAAGIVIALALLVWGPGVFAFAVTVVVAIGALEYERLLKGGVEVRQAPFFAGTAALFPVLVFFWGPSGLGLGLVAAMLLAAVWRLVSGETTGEIAAAAAGSAYIGASLGHLVLARSLPLGVRAVLVIFIATWVYDSVAYLGGTRLGRTKLAPLTSPGKTVEGALAGTVATVAVTCGLFVSPATPAGATALAVTPLGAVSPVPSWWMAAPKGAVFGLLLSLAAPLGDFLESKIKRQAGVKDSGGIIPGHGGVLDRFDSMMLTGVAGYYALRFMT